MRSSEWLGDPAAEVLVDRRFAAAQAQHRRDRAQRRRAADLALPAEADAGQRRPGVVGQQLALGQPLPERAVLVDDVGAEVRLVGTGHAAGAAAKRLVRLEQPHRRAAFGAAVIAAVSPASPPPTIVILLIASLAFVVSLTSCVFAHIATKHEVTVGGDGRATGPLYSASNGAF